MIPNWQGIKYSGVALNPSPFQRSCVKYIEPTDRFQLYVIIDSYPIERFRLVLRDNSPTGYTKEFDDFDSVDEYVSSQTK